MKKRISTLLLGCFLLLSTLFSQAEPYQPLFVFDMTEAGLLTEEEVQMIDDAYFPFYNENSIPVSILLLDDMQTDPLNESQTDSIYDLAKEIFESNDVFVEENGGALLLIEKKSSDFGLYVDDTASKYFSDEEQTIALDQLIEQVQQQGLANGLVAFMEASGQLIAEDADTEQDNSDALEFPFIIDLTDEILTEEELTSLNDKADRAFEKHNTPVYIIVVDDFLTSPDNQSGTEDPKEFAKMLFKDNNLGNPGGVVLMLSMAERDWAIYAGKPTSEFFGENIQEYTIQKAFPYFKKDHFADGFAAFIDASEEALTAYANGEEFIPARAKLPIYWLPLSIALGAAIAYVVMRVLTAPLRTVAKKAGASNYMKQNSLQFSDNSDIFLYRNVTRKAKEKKSSSSEDGSSSSGKF